MLILRSISCSLDLPLDEQDAMRSTVELGAGRQRVPAILQVPEGTGKIGAALLLHGFTARKEQIADSIGRALLQNGVATLAPDLPLHGSRAGGLGRVSLENPLTLISNWRLALREASQAIDYLTGLSRIDVDRVAIIGYSLGSYLSVFTAADDPRIKAIALVAGGDLPARTPFAALVRTIADPAREIRKLEGRPLLMMHGTRDRVILPDEARALFAAAPEPKELRWYDGPHWPPHAVVREVADWVASRLEARPSAPSAPPDEPGRSSRSPRLRRAS
jgi:dienelactone hydrolase